MRLADSSDQKFPRNSQKFLITMTFELQVLDAKTCTLDDVLKALREDGGVKIKGLLTPEEAAQCEKEIRPHLEADEKWEGDFFKPESKRCCGMVGKSRTAAEKVIANKLYMEVCDYVLSDTIGCYWGDKYVESVSKPQLANSIVFSIRPGADNQDLHRDDYIYHNKHKTCTPEEFTWDRESNIGLFVAGTKTTKLNGATRFIPKSHLTGLDVPPVESDAAYAELDVGDAFMMLASCYHGGSANMTKDEERLVYSCFVCRGYLRQEENQYLATPVDVVKSYPRHLQELMGYSLSKPYLGWLDLQDPIKYLGVPVAKDDLI